jgi:hypothetical protein
MRLNRIKMFFHSLLAVSLMASSVPPTAYAGQDSPISDWAQQMLDNSTDTANSASPDSETINTSSTAEWVFTQYPEINDIPINEGQPDQHVPPVYTEEQILQMQWDQLSAHDVAKTNELFKRRTLQIAAYFYTNLQKLLSQQEIEEIYTWDESAY